jgi:cell division cycle 2-like
VQFREEDTLREAQLLTACAGVPFVVSFHELIRYSGCWEHHLVMEYVDLSIAKFLRLEQDGGRILEPTVCDVMWQLLTPTEGMHACGIVHRDIKPNNVLVTEDLRVVKLCDLGLAMSTAADWPPYKPAGTPGYRAPEVLLALPKYDGRVDTFVKIS